jgi:hypothetical protein
LCGSVSDLNAFLEEFVCLRLARAVAELHHQSGRDQRGKLPPLTRQLFVLPFAFTARAVGKVLAFCRPRLEFFSHIKEPTPEQAIALHPCGWIRGGKGRIRDWHDGTQISLAASTCAAACPCAVMAITKRRFLVATITKSA